MEPKIDVRTLCWKIINQFLRCKSFVTTSVEIALWDSESWSFAYQNSSLFTPFDSWLSKRIETLTVSLTRQFYQHAAPCYSSPLISLSLPRLSTLASLTSRLPLSSSFTSFTSIQTYKPQPRSQPIAQRWTSVAIRLQRCISVALGQCMAPTHDSRLTSGRSGHGSLNT